MPYVVAPFNYVLRQFWIRGVLILGGVNIGGRDYKIVMGRVTEIIVEIILVTVVSNSDSTGNSNSDRDSSKRKS